MTQMEAPSLQQHEYAHPPAGSGGTILALGVEVERLTACVLEPVDGLYRLAAWRVATGRDQRPLPAQVHDLCRQLGGRLQRTLWDERRSGPLTHSPDPVRYPPIEQVVVTASPRPRLRVWLAGLTEHNSLAAAQTALESAQAQWTGSTCLEARLDPATLAQELDAARPEALALTGGYDSPDARTHAPVRLLASRIAAALHMMPEHARPDVLYAGNAYALPAVTALLEQAVERRIHSVENVLPAPGHVREQPLAAALNALYMEKSKRMQGFARLAEWNSGAQPILAMEDAFTRLVSLWMELQGLRELHALYAGTDRWLYVWADAETNTVQTRCTGPRVALPDDAGRPFHKQAWQPPLRLVSGPLPDTFVLPAGVIWHDAEGLAPIVAAAGRTAPAAALHALTHDLLISRPPR